MRDNCFYLNKNLLKFMIYREKERENICMRRSKVRDIVEYEVGV